MSDNDMDLFFQLSSIDDHMCMDNEVYYRVSYTGFDMDSDAWEPWENLGCDEALERYYKQITAQMMSELASRLGTETDGRKMWLKSKGRVWMECQGLTN